MSQDLKPFDESFFPIRPLGPNKSVFLCIPKDRIEVGKTSVEELRRNMVVVKQPSPSSSMETEWFLLSKLADEDEAAKRAGSHFPRLFQARKIRHARLPAEEIEWISMTAFLPSLTMKCFLDATPQPDIPVGYVAQVFLHLCDTLRVLHQKRCTHKDVTLRNVLITMTECGMPRTALVDFGAGNTRQVEKNFAVDIQGLCCVVYELSKYVAGATDTFERYEDFLSTLAILTVKSKGNDGRVQGLLDNFGDAAQNCAGACPSEDVDGLVKLIRGSKDFLVVSDEQLQAAIRA
ncbi:hypothetical protein K491DRAFT_710269 [Lophiostoma macrostomum CBS 122681]|uniref:non-specific serine/threonine protein kinase n=1 Tax=Lophiostoma macrostomum CBS 122681 TaxID=1314788 RepID=A0A6A6TQI5_9PLEO|nr:hypothetical protein K491DRAFT_710269 [Lophiostoma macrostomum CBS 122681]